MATIGLRSGKVEPGHYICNEYRIIKAETGWWWVWKDYNTNPTYAHIKPFPTLTDAHCWCRRNYNGTL